MAGTEMNNIGALAANVIQLQDRTVKPVPTKRMNDKPEKKERNYCVMPARAVSDPRINRSAPIIVLMAFCCYTNRQGETWVSQETVGKMLGVTKQAISKHVRKLIETGYIEQITKGNQHYSSRIRVIFDASQSLDEVKANTPAALREDNTIVTPPEHVMKRISNLKDILKGKSSQPQKLTPKP